MAQHQDDVDFTHGEALIMPFPKEKKIEGHIKYRFKILKNTDSIFLDAQGMNFSKVLLNNAKTAYKNNGKKIVIHHSFKKENSFTLELEYDVMPKQTVYFLGWNEGGKQQIWTQGQGKYSSHWIPSFDDMNEKVEFDLQFVFDKDYEVIANGKLETVLEKDGLKTWSFNMRSPMSSYLLAFAIGKYAKNTIKTSRGIPLELLYYKSDSTRAEPTYRHTLTIFEFLEKEIGVPYAWQNYKQIPVKDFLYAGMENTGTTIFSDAFLIDSLAFDDKNYVNVNAHEMAHQWFGNLVTEKDGNHHWLHEGFATYYALLAEAEIFGKEYMCWKLYESAKQLHKRSGKENGEALTDPKASSLTFYEKGAWALFVLRKIVGNEAYRQGIQNYLQKYRFKNVTINSFIREMESTSKMNLNLFRKTWLEDTVFPFETAMESLRENSKEIALFLDMERELRTSLIPNEVIVDKYWKQSDSEQLKSKIISTYHKSLPHTLLPEIKKGSVRVKQALALSIDQVTPEHKEWMINQLEGESYITIENALYKLWIHFPEERPRFLEKTRHLVGMPNKNIRLLWLTLALLTPNFEEDNKKNYYEELNAYTDPSHHFEVRQGAFLFLHEAIGFSDQNLKDLINACTHHSWQFKKYARNLLEQLLKEDSYRKRIGALSSDLNNVELRYITEKLNTQ